MNYGEQNFRYVIQIYQIYNSIVVCIFIKKTINKDINDNE